MNIILYFPNIPLSKHYKQIIYLFIIGILDNYVRHSKPALIFMSLPNDIMFNNILSFDFTYNYS